MPVEETVKLKIKCDNPACPGNTLDPTLRDGWIFISAEVYGQTQSGQFVYCSKDCISSHTSTGVSTLPSLALQQ